MQVLVTVNNKHTLTFEANYHPDSPLDVKLVSRQLDLRQGDRFIHTFDPRNTPNIDRALLPLREKTLEAFGALQFLESSSPLVSKLRWYRSERLKFVLDQIALRSEHPPTKDFSQQAIDQKLEHILSRPQVASHILRQVVSRIESRMPHFFTTERELGTHSWLASGGCTSLPFQIQTQSEQANLDTPFGFANPRETHVAYRIDQPTAFVPKDVPITPVAVLSALCSRGGCGESLRLLNRAAAMQIMTSELKIDIESAKATVEKLSATIPPRQRSFLMYSALNATAGAIGILGGVTYGSELISSGLSTSALTLLGVSGIAAIGAGISQNTANKIRQAFARRDARSLARAQLFLENADSEIQSILAATLLRYIDDRGAGRSQILLAPIPSTVWENEFEGMELPDERVFQYSNPFAPGSSEQEGTHQNTSKLYVKERLEGEELSLELCDEIFARLKPELLCLHHTEVADKHWHLLHATDLCASFAARTGLLHGRTGQLSLQELLPNAQKWLCNRDGYFVPILRSFHQLRARLGLDEEAWGFSARPLFAIHTIDTTLESLAAQRIALEEIMR
jgi:hypothetical protein